MTNIEVGKIYNVNHSRKGKFMLHVESVNEEWVTGIVGGGFAHAILETNEKNVGEEITIRRSFCTFSEV